MGYLVIRSAGSHGVADLVAVRVDLVALIQCKRQGSISVAEWNAFYDAARNVGAVPLLAQMANEHRGIAMYLMTGRREKQGQRPCELWTVA